MHSIESHRDSGKIRSTANVNKNCRCKNDDKNDDHLSFSHQTYTYVSHLNLMRFAFELFLN